jgi:hypothetical protein
MMKNPTMTQRGFTGITVMVLVLFLTIIGFLTSRAAVAAPFIEKAKLTGTGIKPLDEFGNAVDIHGQTAVVGAHGNDTSGFNAGAAYIYARDASGVWSEQAKLAALDASPQGFFGYSVSIHGDTALIGANGNDEAIPTPLGAAYVFTRDPVTGVWSQQAKLLAADGIAGDDFGSAVALDGNTAVIGAFGSSNSGNGQNSGAVYIFTRDPATGTWSQQTKLVASDTKADEFFGNAVAIHGETAVIGAVGNDEVTLSGLPGVPGSAYVFIRNGAGTWTQQAKLTPVGGMPLDFFGISVAVQDNTALIGANGDDGIGQNAGSVYIFARDLAGIWSQQAELAATDTVAQDFFGISVAIDGNSAVVGAMGNDVGAFVPGSAYILTRNASGVWSQQEKLLASDGDVFHLFGIAVSISQNIALVGASQVPAVGAGSAYIYEHELHIEPEICDGKDNNLNGAIDEGFLDADNDKIADCVDPDDDGDGVADSLDNCPLVSNSDQTDTDADKTGDVCDPDDDGDGVADAMDNCQLVSNPNQADTDADKAGDACDLDDDGDGVANGMDNCPLAPNSDQADTDGDKAGNACDLDDDSDTVADGADNCPLVPNRDQADTDKDKAGDACDSDDDADGVADSVDNCPLHANLDQANKDRDRDGDVCDPTDNNIVPNRPPPTSELIFPFDGGRNVSINTTLRWKRVTDPDGDRLAYKVCLRAGDDRFTNEDCNNVIYSSASLNKNSLYAVALSGAGLLFGFVFGVRRYRLPVGMALLILVMATSSSCRGVVEGEGIVEEVESDAEHSFSGSAREISFSPFRLTPDTTYFWRITADDGRGGASDSAIRSFTTH